MSHATGKKLETIGTVAIVSVGVVLILAGALKLVGTGAEDMIEGLQKANLIQHMLVISVLAIVSGVLLLIPQTRLIGLLMSSAYWGGAIVAHMTYDDSVMMPATFQAVLWIGAALRWHSCLRLAGPLSAKP